MTPELEYMRQVMLALGQRSDLTIWRQNCGKVPVRDRVGRVLRTFDAGPPNGAADLSGYVKPEGWRLEIELKSAGGKQSKAQKIFARNVTAGGCIYVLAAPDEESTLEQNVQKAVRLIEIAIVVKRLEAGRSVRRSANEIARNVLSGGTIGDAW